MTKEEIVNFLPFTFCRIKVSKIHGVGVHAVVEIPEGTNLFPDCASDLKEIKKIPKEEVSHLDKSVRKMMDDFLIESDTHYFVTTSLNNINISYFLNHSDNPNCIWQEKDDSFRPLKDLKIGEELTLDYNKYMISDLVKNV